MVTGIANKRSIAWGIAQAFDREGAKLILTYQHERFLENLEKLTPELQQLPCCLALDVASDEALTTFAADAQAASSKGVGVLVHSIAFAERADLEQEFVETSRNGFLTAHNISAYSLTALARVLRPLMIQAGGGTILAMTHQGAVRVMPNYNVMGVAKAALEASVRYLAYDLGPQGIRVNAISAGPVKTLAASGVKGISMALQATRERAPLRENISTEDVGNAAVFLASPWGRHITGQVLYVDSGFHILGF